MADIIKGLVLGQGKAPTVPPPPMPRLHHAAPPIALGHSTGLVYCKRCGYLLSSDSRGDAIGATKPCRDVQITGR